MKIRKAIRNIAYYSVVGCSATAVEWLVFFLLNRKLGLHWVPSLVLATVFSGFTNWAVGRFVLFQSTGHVVSEIGKVYLTSIIGMGYNLVLMTILVEGLGLNEMVAKVIATLLVFTWNYLIRTRVIYKGKLKRQR